MKYRPPELVLGQFRKPLEPGQAEVQGYQLVERIADLPTAQSTLAFKNACVPRETFFSKNTFFKLPKLQNFYRKLRNTILRA
jgi:hypothetical protein